jgi:carbamoyltransferase
MIVLGFSGIPNGDFYYRKYGLRFVGHDSSVALVIDGKVAFAAEEERFSREKHTSRLPLNALQQALAWSGIKPQDIDVIAYTWSVTFQRLLHMFWHHPFKIPVQYWPSMGFVGARVVRDLMWPRKAIRSFIDATGLLRRNWIGVSHHLGHAACAYFTSSFDRAAVLTVDGQGEDESASMGEFNDSSYRLYQSIHSPASIGILYGMITDFLGMRAGWDEYKVMGMSPLGDPTRFRSVFDRLVNLLPEGRYETYRTAMVFRPGYCDRMLSQMFGMTRRGQGEPLDQQHFDVAAGLQAVTEKVLFHLLHHLRKLTTSNDLCLAGGVFLNSLANGKIRRSGLFERVHIPPVPGDHGGALGAAFWAYHSSPDAVRRPDPGFSAFCGPGFSDEEIEGALQSCSGDVDFQRSADVAGVAADWLAAGQILGWFQGRMEYGPRALGHRSILASPLVAGMKDTVNATIKHREPYRPFAGAVPEDRAPSFFEMDGPSPYMQFVFPVIPTACEKIPAIVHNGTCRVQTVSREQEALFHDLLVKFGARTGVPVLLNTSFNDADEPIVCSPQHAVRTFLRTDLDALVMGSYVVRKVRNSNPDY